MRSFDIVSIYPNPASSFVNVSLISERSQTVTISVADPAGKIVAIKKVQLLQGQQNLHLNIKGVAAGSYFIQIFSGNGMVATSKIIKQ